MTQADTQVDEDLEVDESEAEEAEQVEETEPEETDEGESTEEVDVHLEGESPPPEEDEQTAPQWVRDVRKTNREQAREIRELKAKLATPVVTQVAAVGAKPTLAACDYDEDRFDSELTQWHERKRNADADDQKKRDEATNAQKAWQTKLESYATQKGSLKVKDFEDAEAQATEALSVTQQGVILSGATNPALIVYALGKNPKRLQKLASIQDPVKFAFAVSDLQKELEVKPRKTAPLPESTVRGSARVAQDATLTRLEADAEKSGDRSKVIQYKTQLKRKAST